MVVVNVFPPDKMGCHVMTCRQEGGARRNGKLKQNEPGKPLISVITAVLNGAEGLEQTILSVINQSYDNIEYIIIDAGSLDGTLDVIRKHDQAIDYWVSEPDQGIFDAWNKGVQQARGDWIAFLGASDQYLEGAVQSYVDFIGLFGGDLPEYVSSRVNLVSAGRTLRTIGRPWDWENFRKRMLVAHVGSLHHRQLFERYGLYDTTYNICGDYELLLRPRENLRAAFLDKVTTNMTTGGVSSSNPRAFGESLRAKVRTGGRGLMACQLEKVAMSVWCKVRNWLER